MEEQAIKNLYTKYLEEALEIEYRHIYIKKESPTIYSRQCLCDKDGHPLTEYFNSITEHENGSYFVAHSNTEAGSRHIFFDKEGKIINTLEQAVIENFDNGVALMHKGSKRNVQGYINYKGEILGDIEWGYYSDPKYSRLTKVEGTKGTELGKYGFIDETGKIVIPCEFSLAYAFYDGLAFVGKGEEYFFIDETGKKVFDATPGYGHFSENLVVFKENSKAGVKNKQGTTVIPPSYDYISDFKDGIAKVSKKTFGKSTSFYIDRQGNKVKVESLPHGMNYIKKFNKIKFYNKFTDTYDSMEYIPYQDLDTHILCVEPDTNDLYLYNKKTKTTTRTHQKYNPDGSIYAYPMKDFLQIGTSTFYKNNQEYIDVTSNIDITKIISYTSLSGILDYDTFSNKIVKDPDFYNRIISDSQAIKQKQIEENIKKEGQETDRKRKEIIGELEKLKEMLSHLEKTAGTRSNIDPDLLLIQVDDHFEIKPEFVHQLKYLNLAYIDFRNVKVSGLNFEGSNASINPQEVYQKDMSNGNYSGLSFSTSDFNGVNIKGSKFNECNMDFANKDGAIIDESTEFSPSGLKF